MKIKLLTPTASAALAISLVAMHAQYLKQIKDMTKVKLSIPLKALPFDYSDVQLLDDPFKRAMEVDQRWLKEAREPFPAYLPRDSGLTTGAQNLDGWESLDCEVRGRTIGHLLSALSIMYAFTGGKQYRTKGAELVKGLAECQQTLGKSDYLSAFLEHFIDRAIKEEIVWAPFYTLHKVYAGLFDQYTLCNNQQAFDVLMGMCDWVYNKLKPLNHAQLQGMLNGEFGGMKSPYLGPNVTYIK